MVQGGRAVARIAVLVSFSKNLVAIVFRFIDNAAPVRLPSLRLSV